MATAPSQKGNVVGQDTVSPVHSYHLKLASGEERDVKGAAVNIEGPGWVVIRNAQGAHVVGYAPGQVTMYELERQDDRG